MPYRTITEVKRANKASGHFWFSPATVKAFASRVESPILGGRYWVESTTTYNDEGREYKLCVADDDGDVQYVRGDDGILRFETRVDALDALVEHINRIESAALQASP